MVIVDCDVHNFWDDADVLLPYLDPVWKDYYLRGERQGPKAFPYANRPYLLAEGFRRKDIDPPDMAGWVDETKKHCDLYNIDYALLTSDEPIEVSTLANSYYAAGLVSAYNDWQIDYWFKQDSRFKGGLVISVTDPNLAAKEIRRLGAHSDMITVLASSGSMLPLGNPF